MGSQMELFGINFSHTIVWILGIVGTGVTLLVGHRLAVARDRTKRIADACSSFRNTWSSELGSIYPIPVQWPVDIDAFLRRAFPKLQAAVLNFRCFLPWYRRWAFDRAWLRYYSAYRRRGEQCYHHYMAYSSNPGYRDVFKYNVDALLVFAKQT